MVGIWATAEESMGSILPAGCDSFEGPEMGSKYSAIAPRFNSPTGPERPFTPEAEPCFQISAETVSPYRCVDK
jgi:hypothetical protein